MGRRQTKKTLKDRIYLRSGAFSIQVDLRRESCPTKQKIGLDKIDESRRGTRPDLWQKIEGRMGKLSPTTHTSEKTIS